MRTRTEVDLCPILEPGRVDQLEIMLDSGVLDAGSIVGVVGKIDGTGTFNDAGRALTAEHIRSAIQRRLDRPGAAADIPVVLSSGCAGLISPHLTIFSRCVSTSDDADRGVSVPRLTVGRAFSDRISALEIGRVAHVDKVAAAVREAWRDADCPAQVDAVLVKSPSLKPEHFREHLSGLCCTQVTESLGWATDTSALGVAVALDELGGRDVGEADIRRDWSLYSEVAIVSAGPEIDRAEIVLLGNSMTSDSRFRSGHALLRDPLDQQGVWDAIVAADHPPGQASTDPGRVVQLFAKLVLPVDDLVRQFPVSFSQEPHPALVAKAIGATLIGTVIGHSRVFVSGGERGSHQGAPGGGPIAAIVARDAPAVAPATSSNEK